MKMAILNTIEKRESFLVLSQRFFSEIMGQIVRSFDFDCDIVEYEWGIWETCLYRRFILLLMLWRGPFLAWAIEFGAGSGLQTAKEILGE